MAQISDVKLIQGSTERLLRMPFPCDAIFCRAGTLYGFSDSAVMILPGGGNARAGVSTANRGGWGRWRHQR